MDQVLLGIDVGTSGVKAGLFDTGGRLLGMGRAAHESRSPRPGWVECDAEQWWRGILTALAGACEAADLSPADVSAVGVGVLFPTVVALDEEGRGLHPAILYADRRSLEQVRVIEEQVGPAEFERVTGNVLMPGTPAASSVLWLRDERPELYRRARTIGFANTFVTARLTGEFATDPTTVGLSGLGDVREPWRWCEALCERLGIDRDKLPAVIGSGEAVGTVTRAAAQETGLAAGTPVACGAGDVAASAMGGGALPGSSCVYIAGSTDSVALPVREPPTGRRWACTAYVPRGTWMGIGANTSGGMALQWCAREVLGLAGPGALEELTGLADRAEPGCGGLLFLPYVQGERVPVWDARARGAFFGLTAATTRAELARAALEGTALSLRDMLERVDDLLSGTELRAVGGGARNALWNRIKADALQRTLHVLDFGETGALGAALLGGMAAGVYGSFAEAVEVARAATGTRPVEPDPDRAGLYEALYGAYRRLYPATREIAHALNGLNRRARRERRGRQRGG